MLFEQYTFLCVFFLNYLLNQQTIVIYIQKYNNVCAYNKIRMNEHDKHSVAQ